MGIGKKGGVKKGQSTLEMALAFIVIVLLVGGIVKIWLWSNQQIVERQLRYNATRVQAGTGSDSYQTVWPVYKPGELKEGEVLISK
jgi:hypothetical protein